MNLKEQQKQYHNKTSGWHHLTRAEVSAWEDGYKVGKGRAESLSELIEAVGKNGFELAYGGVWRAVKEYNFDGEKFLYKKADGNTPEEAVANLYLKLNAN